GRGLRDAVTSAASGLGLTVEARGDPFAPSDHVSFYGAARPVLFLFTGAHADYHRPTDTWDKLNPQALASVTELAARAGSAGGRGTAARRLRPVLRGGPGLRRARPARGEDRGRAPREPGREGRGAGRRRPRAIRRRDAAHARRLHVRAARPAARRPGRRDRRAR